MRARSFDSNNEHRACQGPSPGGDQEGITRGLKRWVLLARHKYLKITGIAQPSSIDFGISYSRKPLKMVISTS